MSPIWLSAPSHQGNPHKGFKRGRPKIASSASKFSWDIRRLLNEIAEIVEFR